MINFTTGTCHVEIPKLCFKIMLFKQVLSSELKEFEPQKSFQSSCFYFHFNIINKGNSITINMLHVCILWCSFNSEDARKITVVYIWGIFSE